MALYIRSILKVVEAFWAWLLKKRGKSLEAAAEPASEELLRETLSQRSKGDWVLVERGFNLGYHNRDL